MRISSSPPSSRLPSAISWLFQGMLLFFMLGVDVFVDYSFRRRRDKRLMVREEAGA